MRDALQSQAKSGRRKKKKKQARQGKHTERWASVEEEGFELRIGSMYGRSRFEFGRASLRNNQRLRTGRIQTADRGTERCVALGGAFLTRQSLPGAIKLEREFGGGAKGWR